MGAFKKLSSAAQKRVSAKIRKIILEEGLPRVQAAAIAYQLERKHRLKKRKNPSPQMFGPIEVVGIDLNDFKKQRDFFKTVVDKYREYLKEAIKATEGTGVMIRERRIRQFMGGLSRNEPLITELELLKLLTFLGMLEVDKEMLWHIQKVKIDDEGTWVSVDGAKWFPVYGFSDTLGRVNAVSVISAVTSAMEDVFERYNLYR